jgi:cellobiose epimerase
MDPHTLPELGRKARAQLFGHVLPFWTGPALDHEQGGWLAWMDNDLRIDRTQPKGLVVNSRILWTFSAVHQVEPGELYRQMAGRAFDFLTQRFDDARHGGAFWQLDGEGKVLDDNKKIYGQAFYIYALAEYHRAFGERAALERARATFALVERHAHDTQFAGYIEVCRRDWSPAADSRLSDKDMDEKKSMNNHLHLLEACTNLHGVWPDPLVAERLRELLRLFLDCIVDARTGHFRHFFDEQWNPRSDSYTFGHDIEGSWLLCEAAAALGDAPLLERARTAALRQAETVLAEGLQPDGGLCYEGRAGRIVDAGREWWPQAEAVVGFLNAFQLGGGTRFLDAADRAWDYIERYMVDRIHGDWYWRVQPDGQPDLRQPKVSEWKGPYHSARACLQTMQRSRHPSATLE